MQVSKPYPARQSHSCLFPKLVLRVNVGYVYVVDLLPLNIICDDDVNGSATSVYSFFFEKVALQLTESESARDDADGTVSYGCGGDHQTVSLLSLFIYIIYILKTIVSVQVCFELNFVHVRLYPEHGLVCRPCLYRSHLRHNHHSSSLWWCWLF